MLIVDAHLDLSMNAMEWNRDLTKSISEIRHREANMHDKADRRNGMVSFPELRKGNIGLVVGTLIARFVDSSNPLPGWHSPAQAWAQTQAQYAWYKVMESKKEIRIITNKSELKDHLKGWHSDKYTIGMILSLEGADSIVDLDYLDIAYKNGLRAVGPAHYGPGRYANGTDATGHLNPQGRLLLNAMNDRNMILDATHLCDDAFWDAMEIYNAPIWASHNNCRSLVDHNRQFSDDMIKTLISKGAVIGAAFDAWMIVPHWIRGKSNPKEMDCTMNKIIDHMLHICTLAGNTQHIALGTDLDGAYGKEQSPYDMDTISDLQRMPELLSKRGFSVADINLIMHQNWINFLSKNLPD